MKNIRLNRKKTVGLTLALIFLAVFFQNCAAGDFKSEKGSFAELGSESTEQPTPQKIYCLHPDSSQAVEVGAIYSTFTKANGATQSDCDAARVNSVCSATSGTFLPLPAASKTCLVAGQVCAYTTGAGISSPTGHQTGASVVGFRVGSATFPTLCGSQVSRVCQANGQWSETVPLYTSCEQRCLNPDNGSPIDGNASYVYYTRSGGTTAECAAGKVTSTCQPMTGLLSPLPVSPRFANCTALTPTPTPTSTPAPTPIPNVGELDCALTAVRCVSIVTGPKQEYSTLQAAANAAVAGDTVQVFPGTYAGFRVTRSGTVNSRLTFRAIGTVKITTPSTTGNSIHLSNTSYVTVEGFEITNTTDKCIGARDATAQAPMRGLVIRNNKCLRSGHDGMYFSQVADSLIEGNEIANTGADGQARAHGLYLANAGSKGTTIRGNIIHDITLTEAAGIHMNGDSSVGGDGIISGVTIENNTFYNITAHNSINMDGVQNSIIRNNLVYNSNRNAVRGYRIDGGGGPKGMIIYNNTFVVGSDGNPVKFTEDGGGGHVIFNNILLSTGNGVASISVTANSTVTSSRNVVMIGYNLDNSSVVATANNVFQNYTMGDLKLKVGSPALNFGLAAFGGHQAPTNTIEGKPRTGINAGAY